MYEQELNAYWKETEKRLACPKADRERLRAYLYANAQDILGEQPSIAFDALLALLGTPAEAAASYMETLPPGTAEAWERRQKRRRWLLAGMVTAVIVILAGLVWFYYINKGAFLIKETSTIVYYSDDNDFELSQMPTAAPIT